MQPSSRNGRGRDNPRSMNGGFPGLLDPFADFGGLGASFSNVFDNDPFFSDPVFFGEGSFFGTSAFLNSGKFGEGTFLDERPNANPRLGNGRNVPTNSSRRGNVQIEELPDDRVVDGAPNQEPIVEHPEDEVEKTEEVPRSQARSTQLVTSGSRSRRQPEPSNNPLRTYSFQSSSVVFGGDGQYYSSQTTRRQGADGVVEEEHEEKDTTTGRATHRLSRGLKEKGRSFTRKRNAEGREEKTEILHNLEEDEVPDFERKWETLAEKSLPNWNRNSSRGQLGSRSEVLPALPSNGGSRANRR